MHAAHGIFKLADHEVIQLAERWAAFLFNRVAISNHHHIGLIPLAHRECGGRCVLRHFGRFHQLVGDFIHIFIAVNLFNMEGYTLAKALGLRMQRGI